MAGKIVLQERIVLQEEVESILQENCITIIVLQV